MAEIIVCSDASSMLVNLWLIRLIAAALFEYTNSRHSASGVFRNECKLQAANESKLWKSMGSVKAKGIIVWFQASRMSCIGKARDTISSVSAVEVRKSASCSKEIGGG